MSRSLLALTALLLVALAPSCKTESFCFENCGPRGVGGGAATGATDSGTSGVIFDGGLGGYFGSGGEGGATSDCVPAADGLEICNGVDDDCDGATDEPATADDAIGIDFTSPRSCGTCSNNCELTLQRVSQPTCTLDPNLVVGADEGTCDYDACSANWYDADGDRQNGCEYFCPFNPDGTNTTDPGFPNGCGQDDDCDGEIDEDVDLCSDLSNCGACGRNCDFANATGACVTTATDGVCDDTNTQCQIDSCAAGWWDVDGNEANGCEYRCDETNGGVEICDGVDNDCDRRIDNADPDIEVDDQLVGVDCFGGTDGLCSTVAHQGVQKCFGERIQCCDVDSNLETNADGVTGLRNGVCRATTGVRVLFPGDQLETCNAVDDDCDGATDDDATDAGGVCGTSVGTCQTGTELCVGGTLTCTGAIGPGTETCDGLDNDCDGVIDGTRSGTPIPCTSNADCSGATPACLPLSSNPNDKGCVAAPTDVADASGFLACDVPPAAPSGATTPCQAGIAACIGGIYVCQGSITPQLGQDRCFEDSNCDGVLSNQSGLANDDPENCGTCGNDCAALGANGEWECNSGTCNRTGCLPGFIECDGANPDDCETACSFAQSGELCNGADDNCNCQVDEDPIVTVPTVVQVCGVSPSATDAGCTTGVALSCTPGGGWQCTFPAGYCTGASCAATQDVCDGLDNNCDGVADEAFVAPNRTQGFLGQACNSDDGLALKHGPCQTTGTFVCNALGTDTTCNALKNDAASANETCDGVDNDCDGVVDDTADVITYDPRVDQQCFGGPDGVCGDVANAGVTTCVSGTPVCTGANLVFPGDLDETCNGDDDDCDGTVDNNLIDDGNPCGNGLGECSPGTFNCVGGVLICQGGQAAVPEVCDGLDNDCNGLIDNAPTDVGGACDVPPPAPSGATQPCQAGTRVCIGGAPYCQGSIVPEGGVLDECGDDTDCNGVLENQTGLSNSDVLNCGSCGNDCTAQGPNGVWACALGVCNRTGCQNGFIECDGTDPNDCETSCTFAQAGELCNGADDNCNCQTDEAPFSTVPTPVQVCGVSPSATDAGCTTGVALSCGSSGSWECTFPAGYCTGASCAATADVCDGLDNDCDGVVDQAFVAPNRTQGFIGQACNSDDGLALKHGPCQTTGVFVCNGGGTDTVCSALKDDTQASNELCDGVDNDCDGVVDDTADVITYDSRIDQQCFGGPDGVCGDVANAGVTACVSGTPVCTGANLVFPGDRDETCNGDDDDCDGIDDNNLVDDGNPCGNGLGECSPGTFNCVGGSLVCQGGQAPVAELCDGLDNNCDGLIDNAPTDVGGACNVPPAAPVGATQPCQAGTLVCIGGAPRCQGSILPEPGALDDCGDDTDCNGLLENQTGLSNNDVLNCGACGNDCNALDANGNWSCQSGTCVLTSCKVGSIDCDGDPNTCETACTFASSSELCNGIDDDCDCQTDEPADLATPTPVQACGVGPSAAEAGCTTGVTIACVSAAWQCTFPAGYCTGASCAGTTEACDGIDNNCNGQIDEPFKYPALGTGFLGQACASDDGLGVSHGPCRTTGVFQCDGPGTGTVCNATIDLGPVTTESCNSIDDNCDGTTDEGTLGGACYSGTTGLCADPGSAGTEVCVSGAPQCQGGGLVAPGDVPDTCNGIDDDCDGFIDAVAPPGTPVSCEGDPSICDGQGIYSLCRVDQTSVNPADDEFCVAPAADEGAACGSGVGSCTTGTGTCVAGGIQCIGFGGPTTETCNGLDDDCDGVIDGTVEPSGGTSCSADVDCASGAPFLSCLPNSTNGNAFECVQPPSDVADGATGAPLACDQPSGSPIVGPVGVCTTVAFPCQAGTFACQSGVPVCENSITAASTTPDACCEDSNCDGTLDSGTQPDTNTDEENCGACGNDCSDNSPSAHALFVCTAGTCQFDQCEPGFIDCNGDDICETACVATGTEVCNGVDDDCNCIEDDVNPASVPSGTQVCGVRGTTDPLCDDGDGTADPSTGGVLVQCVGGAWDCTFPAGYCDDAGGCSTTADACDDRDNDCDGNVDENFKPPILVAGALGSACFSDDGQPAPGDGACQGAGVFVCNGASATICNAARQDGNAGQELCNGIDDDCDGDVDENYLSDLGGSNNGNFVRPGVVGVDTDASGSDDLWVFQFEASRPNATGNSSGSGNGYHCGPGGCTGVPDGPAGVTLDGTLACSVQGQIPWFNVSPVEVEQTCQALGGRVCDDAEWQQGCEGETSGCTWGYATSCTTSASDTCNLHDFDFDLSGTAPITDGLLPTASGLLTGCYADVGGEYLYDVTGNLREITKRAADDYRVLGGAFNTHAESGATCQFDFISVPATYRFYDTGFRCCFDADPSPGEVCGDGVCEVAEDSGNTCPADCP